MNSGFLKSAISLLAELALLLFTIVPSPLPAIISITIVINPELIFLKIVPTVWDETRVLDAEVADYIIVARRKGNDWFIGALTDNTPRKLTVPIKFLGKGKYKIEIWKDAGDSNVNAEHLEKSEQTITATNKLVLPMVRNGGYVARLQKL